MRCGPVEILRRTEDAKQPVPCAGGEVYLGCLESLAGILQGLPWLLAGGLAIPLTLGAFYRQHRDIDIVVPIGRLADVAAAMRAAGFRLIRRFKVFSSGPHTLDLLLNVGLNRFLKMRPRQLKFCDPGRIGGAEHFMSAIDVFAYEETASHFETCDYGRRFEKQAPLTGCHVRLGGGAVVPCFNLHYVARLKALRTGVIHKLDLDVIKRGLEAADEWFNGSSVVPVAAEGASIACVDGLRPCISS